VSKRLNESDGGAAGAAIYRLIAELYPICRSITGDGVRNTLRIIGRNVPLEIKEVPTGTRVFDWTVPKEWNIRDAYIKNSEGERIIDFRESNLHVVSYSMPVRARMSLSELKPHIHSLPEQPDRIPYRTSYYSETWGFCLTQRQFEALEEGEYDVCIDSSLHDGHLTYGQVYLPGELREEVLISCHVCHPSLCNDNLSGIGVATLLAEHLQASSRLYSYRLLFIPGTIGAITWLALNESKLPNIKHGLVLSGVGDRGSLTYKKSRDGAAEIDRVVAHVLQHSGQGWEVQEFSPYGYDERQFCSPGINLPVGRLSRTPHGTYPEYHTSGDNLQFVNSGKLGETFATCVEIVSMLENNDVFLNLNPKCEPQLGKRGLYHAMGGQTEARLSEMALLWVLNLSDGRHSLLDIAERSGLKFETVRRAAQALEEGALLRRQHQCVASAAH
jgi:aminopeptidase-like protein